MTQRNELSGTERPVRRRPVFVSSVDVRMSRTRWWSWICSITDWRCVCVCAPSLFCVILCSRRSSSARPHVYKGVPGFWDQSAIPVCGFQVEFSSCHHGGLLEVIMFIFSCIHPLVCREFVSSRLTEITPEFRISSVRLWAVSPLERLSVCKTGNSGKCTSRECYQL